MKRKESRANLEQMSESVWDVLFRACLSILSSPAKNRDIGTYLARTQALKFVVVCVLNGSGEEKKQQTRESSSWVD